jgi:hypothetical protein
MIDFSKYEVWNELVIARNNKLIVFSAVKNSEERYEEISGRELFLLDKNNEIIWQVDMPEGSETQAIDGRPREECGLVGDDGLINVYKEEGKYFVISLFGMIFEVDVTTGKAKYVSWTK